ncbi:MAG TPA: 3-phosphoglycerate dehydrogenase [Saprospiraceae bacterium]|nr:3-phosphoglycerate dehydrogenase [Saprospiraceae bacterium]
MIRILANDGIHPDGKLLLEEAGYEVITDKVPQEELADVINDFDVIIVRSATKIRKPLIDRSNGRLKVVCRAGVGLDNIDVAYAKEKGISVFNTPAASSQSVAELVMGHILNISRFLHIANREMINGNFKGLKKQFSKGKQLAGSTMGIIGFGRIGVALAGVALGMGMKVIVSDPYVESREVPLFPNHYSIKSNALIYTDKFEDVIRQADTISLHVPAFDKPLIGAKELAMMKDDAILVNAARGGVVDEEALLEALDSGHLMGAALDVFTGEPTPNKRLLNHPKISVSPHIGASTSAAQSMIGRELADIILGFFGELT